MTNLPTWVLPGLLYTATENDLPYVDLARRPLPRASAFRSLCIAGRLGQLCGVDELGFVVGRHHKSEGGLVFLILHALGFLLLFDRAFGDPLTRLVRFDSPSVTKLGEIFVECCPGSIRRLVVATRVSFAAASTPQLMLAPSANVNVPSVRYSRTTKMFDTPSGAK